MPIQTAANLETPLCAQAGDRKLNSSLGFGMYVPLAHYISGAFAAATTNPDSWLVQGFGSEFRLTSANIAFETAGSLGPGTTVATIQIREANAGASNPVLAERTLTAAERVALTVGSTTPQGGVEIPLTEVGRTRNIAGRRLYIVTSLGSGTPPTTEPSGAYYTLVVQPPNPQNDV